MKYDSSNTISIGGDDSTAEFLESMSKPVDFEENSLASDFVRDNYYKLCDFVRRKVGNKIADPCELVHDVWKSIKKSEQIGHGYDPNCGSQGDFITVGQFVYGRLEKYCMKAKFRSNGALERYEDEIDRANAGGDVDIDVVNFVTGGERKVVKNKYAVHEISAYSSEDLQYIFENASDVTSEEAFERIEDFESIKLCIDELFNWEDERLDIKPFLKNLGVIARQDIPTTKLRQMFSGMIEFTKEQDIFRDSLFEVMTFAIKYPTQYRALVARL